MLGQFSGGLALVDGVDGDCNVAVMDVDVPLHRHEKKTKMRRRERTAKYGKVEMAAGATIATITKSLWTAYKHRKSA